MQQFYARKSIRDSLTYTEKTIVENIKNSFNQNQNQKNKISEKLEKLTKKWDKLVYTFCILFNYFHYVSKLVLS